MYRIDSTGSFHKGIEVAVKIQSTTMHSKGEKPSDGFINYQNEILAMEDLEDIGNIAGLLKYERNGGTFLMVMPNYNLGTLKSFIRNVKCREPLHYFHLIHEILV